LGYPCVARGTEAAGRLCQRNSRRLEPLTTKKRTAGVEYKGQEIAGRKGEYPLASNIGAKLPLPERADRTQLQLAAAGFEFLWDPVFGMRRSTCPTENRAIG
jgi:hypothetical protein